MNIYEIFSQGNLQNQNAAFCLKTIRRQQKDVIFLSQLVGTYFNMPASIYNSFSYKFSDPEEIKLLSGPQAKAYKNRVNTYQTVYPFYSKLNITIKDSYITVSLGDISEELPVEKSGNLLRPLGGWPKWTGINGYIDASVTTGYIQLNSPYPIKQILEFLQDSPQMFEVLQSANMLTSFYKAESDWEKLATLGMAIAKSCE